MMSSSKTNSKCAACGKEGDDLKACTACHMVKYCNRDCQISHRKEHKKACKKRAAELHDERLLKDTDPEECPFASFPCRLKRMRLPLNLVVERVYATAAYMQ